MLTTQRLHPRFGWRYEGEGTGSGPAPASTAPAAPPAGYLSQDEVNRIAAREKDEGKRAAERAMAESLGVTVEEAKQIIADARARDDAEKTEAQKAQARAEAAEKKATALVEEATRKGHEAAVRLALLEGGVLRERLDSAARLVDAEPGASEQDFAKAITAARTAAPEFFVAQSEGNEPPKPGDPPKPATPPTPSDPPGTPPKPSTGEGAFERGAKRATERATASGYAILGNNAPASDQ